MVISVILSHLQSQTSTIYSCVKALCCDVTPSQTKPAWPNY